MTLYCTVSKMCWPKVANFPTQSSLQVAAQGVTLRILQLGSESEKKIQNDVATYEAENKTVAV